MKCNHCNSEVAEGVRFCPNCGGSIEVLQLRKCSQCGTELEEGEKFCSNCGAPVSLFQPQPMQFQHPQQGGQYQQPQPMQFQHSQQGGQYQQPQPMQFQHSQQGGQYQQPQPMQYQQSQQGGQYQQPYQRQYQQPQIPQYPKLSFGEAVSLAVQRLQETDGRSRRSEYWWWVLAVGLGTIVLGFIPYVGCFSYLAQYCLLYAITLRRLHDCTAPEWVGNLYLGTYGAFSIISALVELSSQGVDFANSILRLFGDSLSGILIASAAASLIAFIYSLKDSNPEIDPVYGPSPKYGIQ